MHLLVTGGTGYIGSHTVLNLLKQGHKVTILDNLTNSGQDILPKLAQHGGSAPEFIEVDLRDYQDLESKLSGRNFDACIHFAALIEVGRSVVEPELFFDNNVGGSQNLFKVLLKIGVKKVIFSSTAAVYGNPESIPIGETARIATESPYGTSKFVTEQILADYARFKGLNAIALRYFNPAGSYNGLIGESHQNESHLIPRLLRSYTEPDKYQAQIYGTDYPTPDGTAIRDYIHILDLVDAHIAAVKYLETFSGFDVLNVSTGKGSSIKEVIQTIEEVVGKPLQYTIGPRRAGDSAVLVAGVDKIEEKLDWQAKYNLKDIIDSAWQWENKTT